MPDGLYERDALLWSEQQASLLRRLAAGERVNDAVDWPNVIEEMEAVGRSELRACESLLGQAVLHLLKLHAWPGSQSAGHWIEEAEQFVLGASRAFAPSMRQRLDLDGIYATAAFLLRRKTDASGLARPSPEGCPYALDDLLTARPDVEALVAQLARQA